MGIYPLNEAAQAILRELVEAEGKAMNEFHIAKEKTLIGLEMAAAGAGAPMGSQLRPDLSGFDGPADEPPTE